MNDRLETYPNNPLYQLQQCVKERLEADPWFAEHGVRLMLMDDGEIANLIRREVGVLEGPVLVVAIAEVEGNAPDVTTHFQIIVTEEVLTNRSRAGFDTALGVAWRARDILTQTPDFTFVRLTHDITADGVFQAVADFTY